MTSVDRRSDIYCSLTAGDCQQTAIEVIRQTDLSSILTDAVNHRRWRSNVVEGRQQRSHENALASMVCDSVSFNATEI